VSIDYYRNAQNRTSFRADLRKYFGHGKPVVIAEFGCCTYYGAADKGASAWAIVDWETRPPRLKGNYVRAEDEQARYVLDLLEDFKAEGVEGAFVFTFVAPKYPHHDDPRLELDLASYALVSSYSDASGRRFPRMPREPKLAFDAVAGSFARCAR
jgi:hypothetical protein